IVMSIQLYNIQSLWNMSVDDFNQWRKQNDLPILFKYLATKLPGYNEWLSVNSFSTKYLLDIIPTGELFKGKQVKKIVEYQANKKKCIEVVESAEEENLKRRLDITGAKSTKTRSFVPYFKWAKENLGKRRFIISDTRNEQYSDTFIYNLWEATSMGTLSRAKLFKEFAVLKLGEIKVGNRIIINGKNLDFTDLDYLEIQGDFHGSLAASVAFSSCRDIKIVNATMHHYTFHQCNIENLLCQNATIQDFIFDRSDVHNVLFINSFINGLTFFNSKVANINFDKSEINRFHYKPAHDRRYLREFNNFRHIRTAFQNIGKREEARKYYYLERCYERKSLFNPYINYRNLFPPMKYAGRLIDIYNNLVGKPNYSIKNCLKFFRHLIIFHLKTWVLPKYFFRALKFKIKYFFSLFEDIVWGYGEKPSRTLLLLLAIIPFYTAIFYHSGYERLGGSLINAIYFSVITFTTLGYGDISPKNSHILKLICCSEALIGVILIALLIAGFANRSRY
ncbi:MAG: potassium channel family protein, partial [Promethearchaeota archaeon]